jgi:hypothetical protein
VIDVGLQNKSYGATPKAIVAWSIFAVDASQLFLIDPLEK